MRRSFFDPAFCDELREAISMGEQQRAAVLLSGDQLVDEGQRRSRRVRIEQRYDSVVRDKLQALIPELEKHFDLQLRSFENPQVLIYDPGDRFKVHRDGSERAAGPAYLRERKVSIVAFLNGSSTDTSASGARVG